MSRACAGGVKVAGLGEQPGRDRVGVGGDPDPPAHCHLGGGSQLTGFAVARATSRSWDMRTLPASGSPIRSPSAAASWTRRSPSSNEPSRSAIARAPGERVVVVSGLAEVVLQAKERVEFGAEGGRAALEERVGGEQMSFASALVVSDPLSERHDLAGDGNPLGDPRRVSRGRRGGRAGRRPASRGRRGRERSRPRVR